MPTSPSSANTPSPLPSPPILQFSSPTELPPQPRVTFPIREKDVRTPSVQFAVADLGAKLRGVSPKPTRPKLQGRNSSPPPPSTYENRVSFDTFDNKDAPLFSVTLQTKHKHYAYSKRSRTFLCGLDQNDYSEFALDWLLDELVDDGDEVVCFRVVDKDSKITSDNSIEQGRYKTEAYRLLDHIKGRNKDGEKSLSLVLEFAVGKVQETIQRMIELYEPACLIVGTRGRSLGGIQGLLPGSVSKYCLQNSAVPVIVVRPSSKREKKKRKRREDPTRKSYMDIFEQSGAQGSQILEKVEDLNLSGNITDEARKKEAIAVAKAIGMPAHNAIDFRNVSYGSSTEGEPLTKVTSTKSGNTIEPENPTPAARIEPDDPLQNYRGSAVQGNLIGPGETDAEDQDTEQERKRASTKEATQRLWNASGLPPKATGREAGL